ncbi:MAG: dihydrodipicolinate synthase family protein [Verrucomicrobiota bacterium]
MKLNLSGLVAAAHTPMHTDGTLNLRGIEAHAQLLVESNVAAVFVNGSTGESVLLSAPERWQTAERWLELCREKLRVVVHVGANSLTEVKELAAHAQRMDADAVSAMGPSFFKPAGVADLVAYCAEVAAAAPELPFYYYHIPSLTGVGVSMIEFLQQASARIPNLAGIKYTHYDLMEYYQCLHWEGGRYEVLWGRDEILLSALALGAKGAIGSTYCYAAPVYHHVMEAFRTGRLEEARVAQGKAIEFVSILHRYRGLAASKVIMGFMGVDCGPVRLPLRNLTAAETASLRAELARLDIFARRVAH